MKFKLIYPNWPKLEGQTEFHLPPHGPVVFAASLPRDVEIEFVDENVQDIDFYSPVDFVGISMMLTIQIKRGWTIADEFRKRGIKVIFGGIATMLHAQETALHADSVFLGEAEGRMEKVFADFKQNRLQAVYNYLHEHPPMESIGTARRDILDKRLYNYKGVQMLDLVHASRGCKYHCYPCAVNYLGGKQFRPRPIDQTIREMSSIDNNRLFLVDNSLAQNKEWEKDLFREMIPLKKKWCSHAIEDDPEILDLAAQAGAWYVYQPIINTTNYIKNRVKKYHDNGIAVQGTILLGLDYHTEDFVKRMIDFLLKIDLDLAEFTVLTPFPHTKAFNKLQQEGRIFSFDWNDDCADKVVYYPKHMTPQRLQELFRHAWEMFYAKESQPMKMFKLLQKVVRKEKQDGTYQPRNRSLQAFGRDLESNRPTNSSNT